MAFSGELPVCTEGFVDLPVQFGETLSHMSEEKCGHVKNCPLSGLEFSPRQDQNLTKQPAASSTQLRARFSEAQTIWQPDCEGKPALADSTRFRCGVEKSAKPTAADIQSGGRSDRLITIKTEASDTRRSTMPGRRSGYCGDRAGHRMPDIAAVDGRIFCALHRS